ncbi:MAG TPA: lysylphosphatidylglycerol synthase domain-containing protein [Pseudolabrys sp.]|nr:lysylphosphatidylglycerol synthase domain-containing protein [Pseudolabrys sp.]
MLVVYLIVDSGAGEVAHAMFVIGWWLLPIAIYHIVPLFLSALSWRELLPLSSRPDVIGVTWMRWIRESINALLPVASVGGDIASARLAHLRGVPSAQAAASMVVDTTVGVITQMVFVIAGVALLLVRPTEHVASNVVCVVLIGIAVFFVAVAAFVLFQHKNMFARFAKLARGLLPGKWFSNFVVSASAMDDAVVLAYRSGESFWRANLWRIAGWVAGTGEVWLVTQCVGHPITLTDAFILESLSSGARAAAFVVPGALGVLEGGMVLFGAVLGLPAEIALAISLTKRVRELVLGLPGLFAWYWVEGHYLLRRKEDEEV